MQSSSCHLLIRYLRSGKLPSAKTAGVLMLVAVVLFPATFMYRNAMETAGTGAELIDTVVAAAEVAETGTASSQQNFRRDYFWADISVGAG